MKPFSYIKSPLKSPILEGTVGGCKIVNDKVYALLKLNIKAVLQKQKSHKKNSINQKKDKQNYLLLLLFKYEINSILCIKAFKADYCSSHIAFASSLRTF